MKFTELDLKPDILSGLAEMGYEDMTPIQEQAIPHILAGRDVVGLAETGSGKTSACAIPMVNVTDIENRVIQHLILVPTRELALQYVQEIDDVAKNSGVVPFAVFGGFDIGVQKAKLNHGVHILVATPGRLIDLIWNTKIDMQQVQTVVLDEADEMLDMGFIE
ncbi:MAG: DEAD/DEAH box helicase, partial [Gemmatimonadetes bacterium]|nr:DEAD/DEAH box helicase [Gemmatimonadota bacterium]